MAGVYLMNRNITIIAAAPHTFHGAGIIKHRVLHGFYSKGYDVHFVGLGRPYFFKQFIGDSFDTHIANTPPSEAYRDSGKLFWSTYALAEKAAELAIRKIDAGQTVLFWGTFLFPYVQALCLANDYIVQAGYAPLPVVSFPAGSDIWESGPCVKRSVRLLLDSSQITVRATYSRRFIREIKRRFEIIGSFTVLPPFVDRSQFRHYARVERNAAQRRAGIKCGTAVIVHHSNLRPVKRVQDTLTLVEQAARRSQCEVLLVVVGPNDASTACQSQTFDLFGTTRPALRRDNLTIVFAGLASDVRPYLEIADIAVNTSVHDSFNVSLLEAIWCGVPCITSRAPAISDYLKAGRCGVLLDYRAGMRFLNVSDLINLEQSPFDLEKGASDLAALLYNQVGRDNLANKAVAFMAQYLDPDEVLCRYENVVNSLVKR